MAIRRRNSHYFRPGAEIPDDTRKPDPPEWIRDAARRGGEQRRDYPKRTERLLADWCNAGPSIDVPHLMDVTAAAEYQQGLTPAQRLVLQQACSSFVTGKDPAPFLRDRRRNTLGRLRVGVKFSAVVAQVATCARVATAKAAADDAARAQKGGTASVMLPVTAVHAERRTAETIQVPTRAPERDETDKAVPPAGIAPPRAGRDKTFIWLSSAMLLVRDHPEWTDAAIANAVDVHPSTLSRSPEYQRSAAVARGDKSDKPSGHNTIDADTGLHGVEATAPQVGERIPDSRYYRGRCPDCGQDTRVETSELAETMPCEKCR